MCSLQFKREKTKGGRVGGMIRLQQSLWGFGVREGNNQLHTAKLLG